MAWPWSLGLGSLHVALEMTCHWIRPNVRHIGIPFPVSTSTISAQLTCHSQHSAPVCEILSKSNRLRQKKMTSCRFSRWRISVMSYFRGPIMGSLKTPCTTSYRLLLETTALNCLVFEKIAFLHFGDKQTDRWRNRWIRATHLAVLAGASGGLTTRISAVAERRLRVVENIAVTHGRSRSSEITTLSNN